jgi:hypothetical protein
LDNKYIYLEQAFYGDIGKSHGCIASTFKDSELNSFLTAFTDRPGAIPAGTIMEPYLSAIAFGGKYIFTKTFPDFTAARGGMVFTHVLIAEIKDLADITDLKDLLVYFVSEISNQHELKIISFVPSVPKKKEIKEYFPLYIQKTLHNIITANLPVFFCGQLISFEETLCEIWPGLPLGLKKNFSYTTGFSASTIDRSKTIIYFQENLKSNLKNLTYVDDLEVKKVQIESEIERFVLFKNAENTFEEFVNDLNVQLSDWSVLTPVVKAFQLYQRIDLDLAQDEIRLLVRNVAKISLESSSGELIKNKIIQKLADSVSSEVDSNIKSLRNLILDGFSEGEKVIGCVIEKFIVKAFHSESHFRPDVMNELLVLTDGNKTDWWSKAVLDSFSAVFSKIATTCHSNAWQIFLFSETSTRKLLLFIPADKDTEKIFIETMPNSITNTLAEKISLSIRYKNWFILHAHLLLQYLSAKEAIKVQIDFERNAHSDSFAGTHLILNKLNDLELLAVTLVMVDDLLIREYARRSSDKPILLKTLDVNEPVWLKIWSESLRVTENLAYGIENLTSTLEKVVDLISKEVAIPEKILLLLSESEFSDLSGYQNRENIWKNFPSIYKQKFQQATADGFMKKLLSENLMADDLETEIKTIILSNDYITAFLSDNRSNINAVLIAFSNIDGLKDEFLSGYIGFFNLQLSEFESSKLGIVVFEKRFASSARRIFEKAKNNPSFKIALNKCKYLISFSFYEKLIYGNLLGEKVSIDAIYSEIQNKVIAMYFKGPEHGDIWKRAGGDISKFTNHKTREENWIHGIFLLRS